MQEECLVRGTKEVIPTNARDDLLELAHANHHEIMAMKACARSSFWSPGVDKTSKDPLKAVQLVNTKDHQLGHWSPNRNAQQCLGTHLTQTSLAL